MRCASGSYFLSFPILCENDDQNGIFSRKSHDGDNPYLKIYPIAHVGKPDGAGRSQKSGWHAEKNSERDAPAFIQGGQTEKYGDKGDGI